jgi:hypothetical protein
MKEQRRTGAGSPRKGAFAAFVAAGLMVALLIGVPFVCGQRRLSLATEGTIVDKRVMIGSTSRAEVTYVLVIRSADGEQLSVAVPLAIYRKAAVGMHALKKPGHQWPDLAP